MKKILIILFLLMVSPVYADGISNPTPSDPFTGGTVADATTFESTVTMEQSSIIGAGVAGVDYTLTFDGEDNDGVVTWLEDEDTFDLSCLLSLNLGQSIDEFSIDGTLADDSDTAIPTEKAVKAYVDNLPISVWSRVATTLSPSTAGDDVDFGTGVLKDQFVTSGVALGDTNNTSLSSQTSALSLMGAINDSIELEAISHGSILQTVDLDITSNGSVITASLGAETGNTLTFHFSDGLTDVDVTTPETVALTAGSDTIPQENFLYVLQTDPTTLVVSTSSFPAGEHAPIGRIIVQSASTVLSDGALKQHNYTDHITSSNGQGHLAHVNDWIREQNATYKSGVAQTITGSGTGTVTYAVTSGVVKQLHDQTFPAFSDPSDMRVINDSVTPLNKVSDFASITSDSTGSSLNNKFYNLILWGVCSESGKGESKIFVNLPSGSYNTIATAQADSSRYTNTFIPSEYKGTGFLIQRILLRNQGGSTWTTQETEDLRGQFPNTIAGTSTTTATEFPDSSFMVFNNADNTKEIQFDASGITTATTRTITIPDSDGTLVLIDSSPTFVAVGTDTITENTTDNGVLLEDVSFISDGTTDVAVSSTLNIALKQNNNPKITIGTSILMHDDTVFEGGTGNRALTINDDKHNYFGTALDSELIWDTNGNDSLYLLTKTNDISFSGNVLFANQAHAGKDFGQTLVANPTIRHHDANDPDISDNRYGLLYHDNAGYVIATGAETGAGSGPLTIDNYISFQPRGVEQMRISGTGILTLKGGEIHTDSTTLNWGLIFNNASALSFDSFGQAGILEFDTTSGVEGVKMAGYLAIGNTVAVTGILDEDGLVSDSATNLATQQSIKAYVDSVAPSAGQDAITATAGQTSFTASANSGAKTRLMMVNGVVYRETLHFTVSGTTWTWLDIDYVMQLSDDVLLIYNSQSTGISTTEERSYALNWANNQSNYRSKNVLASGSFNFTFNIPSNFVSLNSIIIAGIPFGGAAGAGKDIDLISSYGSVGQSENQFTESDTTSVYTIGADNTHIDLSLASVFSSLSASQRCGINIDHNGIGGTISYLTIILNYETA